MCHPGPEEKMQIPASPFIPFMKKDSLQRHGTSLPVFLPIVVYYPMFAEKSIQCLIFICKFSSESIWLRSQELASCRFKSKPTLSFT